MKNYELVEKYKDKIIQAYKNKLLTSPYFEHDVKCLAKFILGYYDIRDKDAEVELMGFSDSELTFNVAIGQISYFTVFYHLPNGKERSFQIDFWADGSLEKPQFEKLNEVKNQLMSEMSVIKELNDLRARVKFLESENESLKNDYEELDKKLDIKERNYEELYRKYEELEKENEELSRLNNALKNFIEQKGLWNEFLAYLLPSSEDCE